ncbi:hypothetical protein B0T11DRAFT_3940 [Plectosphaerella cucumerina]|uniref:Uncharacterized protein n=1 Tax=Plectosphaerella cucumerina TaxID=40658 RepID=A0A8K0TQP1_9PEZI|nr:hypothetical protein B0T11DRAFT_3940 [Plectosphaerella cucumerina]
MSSPFEIDYVDRMDSHLLQGCCREAERADIVASNLDGLRAVLAESFHVHMTALIEEMRTTARILRDIADRSQVHHARVAVLLNYLNVVLPCLQRSLRDITAYYEDKTLSREIRWRKMYNRMTEEAGGLPLPQRFALYNSFLSLLKQMLVRSPTFDLNALEAMRSKIMQLREARGIRPPSAQIGPLVRPETMASLIPMQQDPNVHWAEQIFSIPLSSRTPLKSHQKSVSWGPHVPWGHQLSIPKECKILFRRLFDDDRLSLMVYLNLVNQVPYLLIRTFHLGNFWFSLNGAHELRILREGNTLQLRRWSHSEQQSKPWASLSFKTWEEMVLFHCSFVSLKARNALTVRLNPDEQYLADERRIFQGQILDDGYRHTLTVYRDSESRGLRLHAAVAEGDLRRSPVWTAFITHQSASTSWLHVQSRHRIWLRDVQLYVFDQDYRQASQRRRQGGGAFELNFATSEMASKFRDVFQPPAKRSRSRHKEEGKSGKGKAAPKMRIEEGPQVGEVETPGEEEEKKLEGLGVRRVRTPAPRSVTIEEVEDED